MIMINILLLKHLIIEHKKIAARLKEAKLATKADIVKKTYFCNTFKLKMN